MHCGAAARDRIVGGRGGRGVASQCEAADGRGGEGGADEAGRFSKAQRGGLDVDEDVVKLVLWRQVSVAGECHVAPTAPDARRWCRT